nr:hypothetical protein [Bryobacterales bacterium]
WLAEVGKRGWVVLTKDQKARYKPLEIAALKASSACVFILKAGNLRGEEIAARFHEALRAICAMLETEPGPFVAGVTKGGRVHLQQL